MSIPKLISTAILILTLSEPCPSSALTVCAEGCDYSSLQEAIDASSPGDLITVQGGAYSQAVNVTKSLTIRGIDAGSGLPSLEAPNSSALALSADGIVLEGLAVRGSEVGVDVISSYNSLLGMNLSSNEIGILMGGTNNIVSGSNLTSNGIGIQVRDGRYGFMAYDSLMNNIRGLSLNNSSLNNIRNNVIVNNSEVGLGLYNSDGNMIIYNRIEGNGAGIDLYQSKDNSVYENYLSNGLNARDDGINAWDNGTAGNYYSDINCSGAGCRAYAIPCGQGTDRHPLSFWSFKSGQEIGSLTPSEAYRMAQERRDDPDFILLDVRTPEEYTRGRLAGAVNLDYYSGSFRAYLNALDKNKTYVIYCRTGIRGKLALEIMRALGFRDVHNISGGITEWISEGLPIQD